MILSSSIALLSIPSLNLCPFVLHSSIRLRLCSVEEIWITQNRRLSIIFDLQPQDRIDFSQSERLCEETSTATMTQASWVDDALSSAAVPLRSNEFLAYVLATTVPGVHFNVDEEERLPKPTVSPHMLNAGRPRLVDGAREDHVIAGYLQKWEGWGWGSDNAAMKILEAEGSKGSPSPVSGEERFTGDELGDEALGGISHSQCLEFLCRKGPTFLMPNLEDKETSCRVLLAMADNVKVLPPADEPSARDVLNMTRWKASLWELVQEMKIVEENFPSLVGSVGVYVFTSSPYAAFLRALAAEIADARSFPSTAI